MDMFVLDLETLANEGGCVIPAIGWARVGSSTPDEPMGIVSSGKVLVDIQEQLDIGQHVSERVLKWWMKQKPEAIHGTFFDGTPKPVREALEEVSAAYVGCSYALGYGSAFDIAIIESLYKVHGVGIPWEYTSVMCLRTMCIMTGTKVDRGVGTHHDCEHDAVQQGKALIECVTKLQKLAT